MRILFLGPPCPPIELHLLGCGYKVSRTEEKISIDYLYANDFTFGISYRYNYVIRQPEITFFEGRLVNLHISLLPWNRGADPNLWSFLENTPKGVTIHQIDAGLDTGAIILQQEHHFNLATESLKSSYETLSKSVESLFISNSNAILQQAITPVAQSGTGSFHKLRDKTPYLKLLEVNGWETSVAELVGKAIQESR